MASAGTRPRVLVTHRDLPQASLDLLKTKCEITVISTVKPTEADILKHLPDYDALLGKTHIDAKFLDAVGSKLKVISTPSAGFDHMDVAEIKKRGIKVGNAPQVLSAAVAEIALYLLLGAARRAHEGRKDLEQGTVGSGFQYMLGHDLRSKTVGIVGLGSIGVEIVKRLKPFEIKKFVYTGHSRKKAGDELGAEFVSFDDLLKQSDFVIDCVPLNSETENMFNDSAFKKMKKTAVFVNIGRGKTVDTEALVRALKHRTIFAAGLDVTEPEPLPMDHELMKLPNAGSRLKIISASSAGFDHMDIVEIKRRGIKIGYAPKILSAAVAESAVFLLLGAARRAHEGRLKLEQGKVGSEFSWMLGHDLWNKTAGIVELGNIGVEILKRLEPFGIKRFVYTARSRKEIGDKLGAEFVSFDYLLTQSDCVINCLPLNSETEKIFNESAFEKMKETAVFVNIGRGNTVDTEALVKALKSAAIFAAGLDVTEPEPLPVDHELMRLPNAYVLPHMGAATIETRTDMAIVAAQNILNFFAGKPLVHEL